jgi:type VI secretion system protein ImpJ
MRIAIADPEGLSKHRFFLSVNAGATRIDELQELFQHVSKLAGSRVISELIRRSLSGITLIPLPVAPAELKPEVNTFYFRIDTDSDFWREIIETRDIVTLHVDTRIPDPRVRLFAIR